MTIIRAANRRSIRYALARIFLNIAGATESINQQYPVEVFDENGTPVENVDVTPAEVMVNLPIRLLGGF